MHADEKIKFRTYKEATAPVKRVIDEHKAGAPHINVGDVPFCLMEGYEPHVKALFQFQMI
jgi:hypothetical protein